MTHAMRILILALVLLPACFVSRTMVNEPLKRAEIDKLVPGQTKAGDVTAILGAPNEVVQLGTRTAYRYDFTMQKRAGFTLIIITVLNEDTRTDRVWLFFDKDDLLTHLGSTLQASDARYAMPWYEVHEE
jgi:outer membrane protein assembly factor BamE (lipoprotein component of BamABCDE complex)